MRPDTSTARSSATTGIEAPRSPGARKEDWIAQHLRRVYDDALNEDIPEGMLDLLKGLDDESDEEDRG